MNEQPTSKGVWTTDLAAFIKAKLALVYMPWVSSKETLAPALKIDVTGLPLALCSLDLLRTGLRNTNIYMLSVRNIQ